MNVAHLHVLMAGIVTQILILERLNVVVNQLLPVADAKQVSIYWFYLFCHQDIFYLKAVVDTFGNYSK